MNKIRMSLFRMAAMILLLTIAGMMMIIGRGHTVYIDNRSFDHNGTTYASPYKIVVVVDGEQVAKLYDKERGMATCIGQTFDMTLEITQEKGGDEETSFVTLPLPYSMDGVVVNLPAYLAGLPEEAYLTRFNPTPEKAAPQEDKITTDEFILEDI